VCFSFKIKKLFAAKGRFGPSITATKIWFLRKPKTKSVLVYATISDARKRFEKETNGCQMLKPGHYFV